MENGKEGIRADVLDAEGPVPPPGPGHCESRTQLFRKLAGTSDIMQMIVGQLGLPQRPHVPREITNMKDAVDSQELKIQKSLVNEEDILGQILHRGMARTEPSCEHSLRRHHTHADEADPDSDSWHGSEDPHPFHQPHGLDMLSDIWELGSHQSWFQH